MSDQLLSSEKYILFYSTSWLKFPSIYSIYSTFGLIERKSDCDSHLVLHLVFLNQHTCLPPRHDKLSIKNLYSILFNLIDYSFVNEKRIIPTLEHFLPMSCWLGAGKWDQGVSFSPLQWLVRVGRFIYSLLMSEISIMQISFLILICFPYTNQLNWVFTSFKA